MDEPAEPAAIPAAAPWPRGRSRHGGIDELVLPSPDGAGGAAGRMWLCGKHAVGPDPEAALLECGATTVVCLTERFELDERYPAYARWLDEHVGGRAVWCPIPDLHAPSVAVAVGLVDELHRRLRDGESLLVHCAAGIGRTGTIAACVLIASGMDVEDALAHVAGSRPMAGPEVGAQRALVDHVAALLATR